MNFAPTGLVHVSSRAHRQGDDRAKSDTIAEHLRSPSHVRCYSVQSWLLPKQDVAGSNPVSRSNPSILPRLTANVDNSLATAFDREYTGTTGAR